jgi:hypothetical protein
VRTTRGNDYYLTITESKKRFDGNGYERHKIFLYKEDFNKFIEETTAVIDHIKSLMPDFDFDAFNHKYDDQHTGDGGHHEQETTGHLHEEHIEEQHMEEAAEEMESGSEEQQTEERTHHEDDDDLKL